MCVFFFFSLITGNSVRFDFRIGTGLLFVQQIVNTHMYTEQYKYFVNGSFEFLQGMYVGKSLQCA